jgi:hypothetical protein
VTVAKADLSMQPVMNLFEQRIRDDSHGKLFVALFLFVSLLGVFAWNRHAVHGLFIGPREVTWSELQEIDLDTPDLVSIKITGAERASLAVGRGLPWPYSQVITSGGQPSDRYFWATTDQGDFLVSASKGLPAGPQTISGVLTRGPAVKSAGDSGWQDYQTIDVDNDPSSGWGIIIIPGLLLLLLCAAWLVKTIQDFADPAHSALGKRVLAKHPDGLELASRVLDPATPGTTRYGSLIFGDEWLVSTSQPIAMRLDDIVWIYPRTTQSSTNSRLPVTTYSVNLRDRHDDSVTVNVLTEGDMRQAASTFASHAPFATCGYFEDVDQLWKRNRGEALELLQQRRSQQQHHFQSDPGNKQAAGNKSV